MTNVGVDIIVVFNSSKALEDDSIQVKLHFLNIDVKGVAMVP